MTGLTVRRLLIDLETPFARHWCGADAFLSALVGTHREYDKIDAGTV